jgi:hypothetical protein
MRQWKLPATEIRHDAVVYTTATPASGLTQGANAYYLLVGDNVLKYRQIEILDAAEWLQSLASAAFDTPEFPRPADIGGTFLRVPLIVASSGVKHGAVLLTPADMSTHPLSSEDNIYWGLTGEPNTTVLNNAKKMGSGSMERALNEIKHYYIASAQASQ